MCVDFPFYIIIMFAILHLFKKANVNLLTYALLEDPNGWPVSLTAGETIGSALCHVHGAAVSQVIQ